MITVLLVIKGEIVNVLEYLKYVDSKSVVNNVDH